MTKENAKKMLPIIIAFAEGKAIECNGINCWEIIKEPNFNSSPDGYRIKEEPIKELLLLMQAFLGGKTIQWCNNGTWIDDNHPVFNDDLKYYRIKKDPEFIPFTFEDNLLFRDKWIKNKDLNDKSIYRIIIVNNNFIGILDNMNKTSFIAYNTMFKYYKFEDGSICGKIK